MSRRSLEAAGARGDSDALLESWTAPDEAGALPTGVASPEEIGGLLRSLEARGDRHA